MSQSVRSAQDEFKKNKYFQIQTKILQSKKIIYVELVPTEIIPIVVQVQVSLVLRGGYISRKFRVIRITL